MNQYPVIKDPARPYRLWHATGKPPKTLPWYNYTNAFRAVIGAYVWQKKYGHAKAVIAVIDVRYGSLIGEYIHTGTGVIFRKENHRVIDKAIPEA